MSLPCLTCTTNVTKNLAALGCVPDVRHFTPTFMILSACSTDASDTLPPTAPATIITNLNTQLNAFLTGAATTAVAIPISTNWKWTQAENTKIKIGNGGQSRFIPGAVTIDFDFNLAYDGTAGVSPIPTEEVELAVMNNFVNGDEGTLFDRAYIVTKENVIYALTVPNGSGTSFATASHSAKMNTQDIGDCGAIRLWNVQLMLDCGAVVTPIASIPASVTDALASLRS